MAADLVAVIVTYNSATVLPGLLDSIPAGLAGLTAEIVVVDNGSTDATLATIAGRDDITTIRSENVGYAEGINRGVREATSSGPILVLNPDVRLHPDSIKHLMAALAQDHVGIVAPRVTSPNGELHRSLRREPTIGRALGLTKTKLPVFSEYVDARADYDSPQTVAWALGAVLLVDRRCYDELGGWDPTFFLYSEETDFCLRAGDAGYLTRYIPDAVVEHIGGQSGQNSATHSMQIVNRVRLYRRRHGFAASAVYYGVTVLNEGTKALRPSAAHSRAAVTALVRPSARPRELNASDQLIPR